MPLLVYVSSICFSSTVLINLCVQFDSLWKMQLEPEYINSASWPFHKLLLCLWALWLVCVRFMSTSGDLLQLSKCFIHFLGMSSSISITSLTHPAHGTGLLKYTIITSACATWCCKKPLHKFICVCLIVPVFLNCNSFTRNYIARISPSRYNKSMPLRKSQTSRSPAKLLVLFYYLLYACLWQIAVTVMLSKSKSNHVCLVVQTKKAHLLLRTGMCVSTYAFLFVCLLICILAVTVMDCGPPLFLN